MKWHNNRPVYSVQSIIEFALISTYFNYSIDVFKKYNIGIVVAAIGILIGSFNIAYLQPVDTSNTYFILFEGITVISMALFYFFRMFIGSNKTILYIDPHFWFASVFLLWWNLTFLNWGLLGYFVVKMKDKVWMINLSIMIVNIAMYSLIGIIFLLYQKFRSQNAR